MSQNGGPYSALKKSVMTSLLEQYGRWEDVPESQIAAAGIVCNMDGDDIERCRAIKTRILSVAAPPERRSKVVSSPVRRYIHDRPKGAIVASAVQEDSYNLRRVLTEIQLRMPALRRLQEQAGDLDSEIGQVRAFGDVFALLDEDGSGAISEAEFVAFGRRVGGECARVFNSRLFRRIDSKKTGEVDRDQFITMLFPKYALLRRKKETQEQDAEQKRREAASWEEEWHPTHMKTLRTLFDLCSNGHPDVGLDDLCRVYSCRPEAKWIGGTKTLLEDFLSVSGSLTGRISFRQFADLMKPSFAAPPTTDAEEITEFYYVGVDGRW
jgi:hypothetical protein